MTEPRSKFSEDLHALVSAAHVENAGDREAIADMIMCLTSNLGGVIGFSSGGIPGNAASMMAATKSLLDNEVERSLTILQDARSRKETRQ